jgi:catechol 2,3-dioxygenase-like lactoylglutathione lyase family enzyme
MKLNHANLPASNVPALRDFFVDHFDFTAVPAPGGDKFAVLKGEDGFILNLMYAKDISPDDTSGGYPKNFHVGFFVETPAIVGEKHAALIQAGFEAGEVEEMKRGGFSSVTFYCYAPGGVLVEVTAQQAGA